MQFGWGGGQGRPPVSSCGVGGAGGGAVLPAWPLPGGTAGASWCPDCPCSSSGRQGHPGCEGCGPAALAGSVRAWAGWGAPAGPGQPQPSPPLPVASVSAPPVLTHTPLPQAGPPAPSSLGGVVPSVPSTPPGALSPPGCSPRLDSRSSEVSGHRLHGAGLGWALGPGLEAASPRLPTEVPQAGRLHGRGLWPCASRAGSPRSTWFLARPYGKSCSGLLCFGSWWATPGLGVSASSL